MVDVLADKRSATRFRVLAEIADRQPAVSQGEIADAVGVTSQAVSEYIRELTDDGLVRKQGRSRYRVTKEGVDWLLRTVTEMRQYADRVSEDVLGGVSEDTAIATDSIETEETVTLEMRDGLLHATPGNVGPATGIATTDADTGGDVGVTEFEGIIDLEPGTVTIFQVPSVRSGGSDSADVDRLRNSIGDADLVVASGIEAVVVLRRTNHEPAVTFAAGEVAAEAASRGLDVVIVSAADAIGRITDPLQDAGTHYEVTELA